MITILLGIFAFETAEPVAVSAAIPGVSFDQAPRLQTRPCYEEPTPCVIVFDPRAEAWIADLFQIALYEGSLAQVAAEQAGFERREDGSIWTTYGRFMPVRVEPFELNGQPALRAINSCGISDPGTGFHAAGGECLTVVVSNGSRTVILHSSGYPSGLEAADAVLPSIRLSE